MIGSSSTSRNPEWLSALPVWGLDCAKPAPAKRPLSSSPIAGSGSFGVGAANEWYALVTVADIAGLPLAILARAVANCRLKHVRSKVQVSSSSQRAKFNTAVRSTSVV